MPANTSDETAEIGIRELRAALSDVVHETAVRGRITYVTSRGRRVAAIVPVPVAEGIVEARKQSGTTPAE
ncbi:type II toxin-antitoxin system prevent-host-death family antitoxin [Streptomyces variegatus]|uniref:type II toxin-antitoxin system prevent-host-death family antitoxin n=1 Tax=Streptomyces variegatus TaxID=284040 RepID=UPI003C302D1B